MRKVRRDFNDSELSLFGTLYHAKPTHSTGRGQGSMGSGQSSMDVFRQIKTCRYSVMTRMFGQFAKRVFATTLTPWGVGIRTVEIEIQADAADLRGYHFMSVRIGDKTVWMSQKDARNLAQVLNAAANSCNAHWRKSSVTI